MNNGTVSYFLERLGFDGSDIQNVIKGNYRIETALARSEAEEKFGTNDAMDVYNVSSGIARTVISVIQEEGIRILTEAAVLLCGFDQKHVGIVLQTLVFQAIHVGLAGACPGVFTHVFTAVSLYCFSVTVKKAICVAVYLLRTDS